MVSVAQNDEIRIDHIDSLLQQIIDSYSSVYGQPCRGATSRVSTFVNDFDLEKLALDTRDFYFATQVGSFTLSECYNLIFNSNSNFNDGNDTYNGPEVFGAEIQYQDINQLQNGIDLAKQAGQPSYSNFTSSITGTASSTTNVAADDDNAKIFCEMGVDWSGTDADGTVATNINGATASYTGNNTNKIRFMTQCGGRIVITASGTGSNGTSKDEDVKSMLNKISYIHNPWPITSITLSDNWSNYSTLQTETSTAYSGNVLRLICRRDSSNVIHYALHYIDGSDGGGSGTDYTETAYDEAVTTNFNLSVRVYYPGHLVNKWKPSISATTTSTGGGGGTGSTATVSQGSSTIVYDGKFYLSGYNHVTPNIVGTIDDVDAGKFDSAWSGNYVAAITNVIAQQDGTGGLPYIYIGNPNNTVPSQGTWTSLIVRDLDNGTSRTLDRSFATTSSATNQPVSSNGLLYQYGSAATWAFIQFTWRDSNDQFLPIYPSSFNFNGGNFEIEFI